MSKKNSSTQKTLSLLLMGKGKLAKKFAGKHVMVVKNRVFPLKDGDAAMKDFTNLKGKYKEPPLIVFVPRQDVSYILYMLCK